MQNEKCKLQIEDSEFITLQFAFCNLQLPVRLSFVMATVANA
jgi:hypothetical protein